MTKVLRQGFGGFGCRGGGGEFWGCFFVGKVLGGGRWGFWGVRSRVIWGTLGFLLAFGCVRLSKPQKASTPKAKTPKRLTSSRIETDALFSL